MSKYLLAVTPAQLGLTKPEIEGAEIKHLITSIGHCEGASVYWVTTDLPIKDLMDRVVQIFKAKQVAYLDATSSKE